MSIKTLRDVAENMRLSGIGEWKTSEMFLVDGDIDADAAVELMETARTLHNYTGFKTPYKTMIVGLPFEGALIVYFVEQKADGIHFVWAMKKKFLQNPCSGCYKIAQPLMPVNMITAVKGKEGNDKDGLVEAHGSFLVCSLALLCVRGVEKEKIVPTEALQKARLRRRKEPLNTITVVRIQKHMKGDERGPAGERMAVRLHLRRGHYRRQHYGPGNVKIREVFIEACLVGYEDQGIITHDHYEIDEAL